MPKDPTRVVLSLRRGGRSVRLEGRRVQFSPHSCLAPMDEAARRCVSILAQWLARRDRLAIVGARWFKDALFGFEPSLRAREIDPNELPQGAAEIFLAETRAIERWRLERRYKDRRKETLLGPEILVRIAPGAAPARAWTPCSRETIYPIDIPEIEFESDLDLLLLDCPARNLGLLPNGVGYVHEALAESGVRWQTFDLDIVLYHRFHARRIFDDGGEVRLADGRVLPADPWQAEHYDLWEDSRMLEVFAEDFEETVRRIAAARPKVLGLSIHACNENFSRALVRAVRERLPDLVVVVGGFSCYSADIGLLAFPEADYMCIGEADLTVAPLVERLARGERPANLPGVRSRSDDANAPFVPAPMPHNLDRLRFPRYDWFPFDVYRNHDGYQLTPILASRGCRWSRCTFCAERFYWRTRSPRNFVDELEWLVSRGCRLFMFNESDLNGMPERLLAICDEILRRGLKVKLTGQLRMHPKSDRAFFDKLRAAGFVALRFGVDGFSENSLRLQRKGYRVETILANLRDCWEAGIYTEVNWVIGVPGETESDVDEAIAVALRCRPYIGRLANINPLILVNGGVYWLEPDEHNIHFREPKEDLYRRYPRAIPAHLWYSTDPYIDEKVRKRWFERIVRELHAAEFPLGPWAEKIVSVVEKNQDAARSGPAVSASPTNETAEEGASGIGEKALARSVEDEPAAVSSCAKAGEDQFRAGARLGDPRVERSAEPVYLFPRGEERFAIDRAVFEAAFGDEVSSRLVLQEDGRVGAVDLSGECEVEYAYTKEAVHELVVAIGDYHVVKFDGRVYGIPIAAGRIELRTKDPSLHPGVLTGRSVAECIRMVEQTQGIVRGHGFGAEPGRGEDLLRVLEGPIAEGPLGAAAPSPNQGPTFVETRRGYRIVEFEGWYYALPGDWEDVLLEREDVLDRPGVIRDVSLFVVQHEIELAALAGERS